MGWAVAGVEGEGLCVDEMWVTSRVESSPRLILGEETGTSDLQAQELNFAKIKKEPGRRFFP